MKVIHLTVLVVVIFLLSCGPKTGIPYQTSETFNLMEGKWQWDRTEIVLRGVPPRTITPESLGKTMAIEFQRGDKLAVYHNDQLVATYNYTLEGLESEDRILQVADEGKQVEPVVESGPMHIRGDSLIISGGFDDTGGTQYFKKMK